LRDRQMKPPQVVFHLRFAQMREARLERIDVVASGMGQFGVAYSGIAAVAEAVAHHQPIVGGPPDGRAHSNRAGHAPVLVAPEPRELLIG